jgi:hypothetical protein
MTDLVTTVKGPRAPASESRNGAFVTAGSDGLFGDADRELASRFQDLAAIEALARHGPFLDEFAVGNSLYGDGS